ncbi:transposase [Streptomyces sp. 900116325]
MSAVPASSFGVPYDCLAHRLGNAADRPDRPRRYGSDLTDAEWVIVRPLLPVPAWLNGRGGRPEGFCHRQILICLGQRSLKPLQLAPQFLRPSQRHPLAPLQHTQH